MSPRKRLNGAVTLTEQFCQIRRMKRGIILKKNGFLRKRVPVVKDMIEVCAGFAAGIGQDHVIESGTNRALVVNADLIN